MKGSEFVEVSQGGLEDTFYMLKSPEAEVNPRYRAVVGGYVFIKNAIIQARAAIRLAKNEEEKARLREALGALHFATNFWPIRLPFTAPKTSQTPPHSYLTSEGQLEESQPQPETREQSDQDCP